MARIAGVDIPDNKRGVIGLTYIFGIGRSAAKAILTKAGISFDKKAGEWDDDESTAIRNIIAEEFRTEGVLKSEIQLNIKRLQDIGCYRGLRHRKDFQFVVSIPRTTPEQGRVREKQLLTRRKQLNKT